jgi:hypothetical protein
VEPGRIRNADVDMLDVFVPPGAAAVSFSKALAAQGSVMAA